jgi:hypothetical protein
MSKQLAPTMRGHVRKSSDGLTWLCSWRHPLQFKNKVRPIQTEAYERASVMQKAIKGAAFFEKHAPNK